MTTFIDQAGLTARYGAEGLARLSSARAILNTEAVARIAKACADANGQVGAAVVGLSLDLSGPPDNLVSIAARLAARRLRVLTWGIRILGSTQKAIEDEAIAAEKELEAIRTGVASGDGVATPAQTVAGQFTWSNVADSTDVNNTRQTTRYKMRKLP